MKFLKRRNAPNLDLGELMEKVYTPDFVEELDKVVMEGISELEKTIVMLSRPGPTKSYAPIVVAQHFEFQSEPYITNRGIFYKKYDLVLPYLGKRFVLDGVFYNRETSELKLSFSKITDRKGAIAIFGPVGEETRSIELPKDINKVTVCFSQNTYKLSKEDNKE